jgi:hypothetical protein
MVAEELYDYSSESSTVRSNSFFVEKENVVQDPVYVEKRNRLRKRLDQVLIERRLQPAVGGAEDEVDSQLESLLGYAPRVGS